MVSEQVIPVDSIKDVFRSSVLVPEFDEHQKKAGGHIGRNVMEITIKMRTIVRKPLIIKSVQVTELYLLIYLFLKKIELEKIPKSWIITFIYFFHFIFVID